jgi:hypothetical protein
MHIREAAERRGIIDDIDTLSVQTKKWHNSIDTPHTMCGLGSCEGSCKKWHNSIDTHDVWIGSCKYTFAYALQRSAASLMIAIASSHFSTSCSDCWVWSLGFRV